MIAQLLEDLGYTADEASIISLLLKNNEVSQYDAERGCDINQPRVSNAFRSLQRKGIVKYTMKQVEGKRKAIKFYTVKKDAITQGPEEQIKTEYERKMKVFAALKNDNL